MKEVHLTFPNLMIEMKARNYSQKGVAALTGIGLTSLSSKMNDRSEFTLREMEQIRALFPNTTLDYLFLRYQPKE